MAETLIVLGNAFDARLREHGREPLIRQHVNTVQVNVGKLCNQACHHCHVDAGPKRREIMSADVVARVLELVSLSPAVTAVDITGGAPELNPNFQHLVTACRALGKHVIDRCNLTVLFEPAMDDLAAFLADHEVEITASLPCYTESNVDAQRGRGVFAKSIAALQELNRFGFGRPGSSRILNLVFHPSGPSLPPSQASLEADYRRHLFEAYGIQFTRLFTLTNMPIHRFADDLRRSRRYRDYMTLLENSFNPATLPDVMCRGLVSVGWTGELYDCDFNQMLNMHAGGEQLSIWNIDSFEALAERRIATASHCFGCTAGSGSSCGGSLA
ncbi:MAG: arsenosugar biosynthesis radical SAM protein ArsS [Acidobacteriales bacterium]|nr:arsenosugar biosynthesis radical SAM protein ArsS [Terriglobales bacterium]